MSNVKVIDRDGAWVINTAMFRMVDPTNGEGQEVLLEPGVPTKVKKTGWMASQPMIKDCPDPMGDSAIPKVVVPTESTLVPTNPETREPDASAAPGIAGTAGANSAKEAAKDAQTNRGGKR